MPRERAAIGLVGARRRRGRRERSASAATVGRAAASSVEMDSSAPSACTCVEIMRQHRLARRAERQRERVGVDEGIAVAVAADPAAEPQEARRPLARARAPSARRAPAAPAGTRRADRTARSRPRRRRRAARGAAAASARARRSGAGSPARPDRRPAVSAAPGIAQPHQLGDAVAMVDHALAPHLGRMGGEHRHDQRAVEQGGDLLLARSLPRASRSSASATVAPGSAGDALPVLGEIGEHREEHEAAHEGERVVEAERVEAGIDRVRRDHAAMPVDRGRADIFDPPEQRVAAIGADDVAEQLAEEADVRILLDAPASSSPAHPQLGAGIGHALVGRAVERDRRADEPGSYQITRIVRRAAMPG